MRPPCTVDRGNRLCWAPSGEELTDSARARYKVQFSAALQYILLLSNSSLVDSTYNKLRHLGGKARPATFSVVQNFVRRDAPLMVMRSVRWCAHPLHVSGDGVKCGTQEVLGRS